MITKFRRPTLAAVFLLSAIAPCHAFADDCRLVPFGVLTPEAEQQDRLIVGATIAGHPARVLLDMDAEFTQVSAATAAALDLSIRTRNMAVRETAGADFNDNIATLKAIVLGSAQIPELEAAVVRDPLLNTDFRPGANFMNQFDMEIDLGHNAIRLFSTKHCEGKVVYWSPDYLELPFTIGRTGKLVVDAIVNGKSVKARLAPGWAHSSVRSDALAKIGAAAGSKGTILLDSLEFGGIKLPHINAVVYDPEPDAAPITGSHLTGRIDTSPPEFTIGNDVLRRLRLYIAIKENKAYFTLASAS